MKSPRMLGAGLVVTLLLASAGLLSAPCVDAAAAAEHGAHHHAAGGHSAPSATAGGCCQQCEATCGVVGCSAVVEAPLLLQSVQVVAPDRCRADPVRYRSPPPHLPFRPPIQTL